MSKTTQALKVVYSMQASMPPAGGASASASNTASAAPRARRKWPEIRIEKQAEREAKRIKGQKDKKEILDFLHDTGEVLPKSKMKSYSSEEISYIFLGKVEKELLQHFLKNPSKEDFLSITTSLHLDAKEVKELEEVLKELIYHKNFTAVHLLNLLPIERIDQSIKDYFTFLQKKSLELVGTVDFDRSIHVPGASTSELDLFLEILEGEKEDTIEVFTVLIKDVIAKQSFSLRAEYEEDPELKASWQEALFLAREVLKKNDWE